MSDLISLLHRSHISKDDFKDCISRLNLPSKMLVQDVKTRWNSVFEMLESYIDLKEAVIIFQAKESAKGFSFSPADWHLAEDIKQLLAPAQEATIELSGESYVSGSKVIPMTKLLMKWYAEKACQFGAEDPGSVKAKFADVMTMSLQRYLGVVEKVDPLALSTLCDPRYKKLAFRDSAVVSRVVAKLKEETRIAAGQERDDLDPEPETDVPPAKAAKKQSLLWGYFDKEEGKTKRPEPDRRDRFSEEVVKYLNMPNGDRSSDPIKWWINEGKDKLPNLSSVALKALILPGTSVPSERVFSSAGNIISKKRARLSDDCAASLIFLHENLKIEK